MFTSHSTRQMWLLVQQNDSKGENVLELPTQKTPEVYITDKTLWAPGICTQQDGNDPASRCTMIDWWEPG